MQKRGKKRVIIGLALIVFLLFSLLALLFEENVAGAAVRLSNNVGNFVQKATTATKTLPPSKDLTARRLSTAKTILSTRAVPYDPRLTASIKRKLSNVFCYDRQLTSRPNLAETDVDCGGPLCAKCEVGKYCQIDTDCKSGVCQRLQFQPTAEFSYRASNGICTLPSCSDGRQDGTETGVDCGGTCKACTQCIDTDRTREAPQESLTIQGAVTDITGRQGEDFCTSVAGGNEAYCDAKGLLGFSEFTCPAETVCQDGHCAFYSLFTCDDPDATDNEGGIHQATTVIDSQHTRVSDSCANLTVVQEGKCGSDNLATSTAVVCPATEMCQDGKCTPILCDDPDVADSAYLATITTDSLGGRVQDSCLDDDTILEGLCSPNAHIALALPLNCTSPLEVCRDGVCLAPDACSDADNAYPDYGASFASTAVDSAGGSKTDTCASETTVREAVCDAAHVTTTEIACAAGEACLEGRCILLACTDIDSSLPDGGIHLTSHAADTLGNVRPDSCFNTTMVAEAVCTNNRTAIANIACPEEQQCLDGACVPREICYEPDPAQFYPGAEVITTTEGFHLNRCVDSTTLNSIICRYDDAYSGRTPCQYGCENARCNNQPNECRDTDVSNDRHMPGLVTWVDGDWDEDYCIDWTAVRQTNCATRTATRKFSYSETECASTEICIPGRRNGICREVTTQCTDVTSEGLAGKAIHYQDRGSGEVFTTGALNECFMFDAPASGPARPRRGMRVSCTIDPERPAGAQDVIQVEEFTCAENEVCSYGSCRSYNASMNDPAVTDSSKRLCLDTDGGLDPTSTGALFGLSIPWGYGDYCVGRDAVQEHSCSPEGLWQAQTIICPSGTLCEGGACTACADTDPENIPEKRGTVKYLVTGEIQADICLGEGSTTLIQMDCNEETGVFTEVETECATSCENGECVGGYIVEEAVGESSAGAGSSPTPSP